MTKCTNRPQAWDEAPVAVTPGGTVVLEIHTDGGCHPNPGPGGWGWHRSDGEEASGGARYTTSNRMELTAILRALEALPNGARAKIISDSRYCVDGLNMWSRSWAKRNWVKKDGSAVLNADLWQAVEAQRKRVQVRFAWVRSHSGDAGNERADQLATDGKHAAQRVAA